MRIAILMGISYENSTLESLPACKNDLDIIEKIITATNLYEEKLILNDDYSTAYTAIETLTNFVESIEKKAITVDEVFVYYSGHGGFHNDEFYYVWNNYSNENPNTTSLLNSQVDDLLRRLKAKLTVKFIDACQSGVSYIKDTIQPTFQDCFFCFSCRKNQSSRCDEKNSYFTYAFVEAIKNCLENNQIRYRDLQNYIADKFSTEGDGEGSQKPYFCSQGKNTDVFCEVTNKLKNVIEEFFVQSLENQTIEEKNNKEEISEIDYLDIISRIDLTFLNKEIIKNLSKEFLEKIKEIPLIDSLNKIHFTKLITSNKIDSCIPGYKSLCTFVDNNCSDFFVKITYEYKTQTVKKEKKNPLNIGLNYISLLASYNSIEPTYEWVDEAVKIPKNFYIKNDLPYDYISFKLQSQCRCITDKELIFIPFYNNTSIYLVYAQFDYKYTGIEEMGPIPTTWRGKKCNTDNLLEITIQLIKDFQDDTFKTIKEFLEKEISIEGDA